MSTKDEPDEFYDEDDELEDSDSENDPNVFKVRGALPAPTVKRYSLGDLHELIHQGEIELNPPWQREEVWSEAKQIHLIDSIFRNIYIPPVVFAQDVQEGELVFVCVDGKQRLTSILKFMDGQICYKDERTKKKWWYMVPSTASKSRPELPSDVKEVFAKKEFTCVEYRGLKVGQERIIFKRVQLGMPLTTAEKLQAVEGPHAIWIETLLCRYVTVEGGLSHTLDWDTSRARDYQCLVHLVYCCGNLEQQPTYLSPAKVEEWVAQADGPSAQFKGDIKRVLDELSALAVDDRPQAVFTGIKKRLAPVEFVFIGVLLYALSEESYDTKALAAYKMRRCLRDAYQDIRMNNKVIGAAWNLIGQLQDNAQAQLSVKNSTSQTKKGTVAKRKRGAGNASDEEYKTTSKKKTSKSRTS